MAAPHLFSGATPTHKSGRLRPPVRLALAVTVVASVWALVSSPESETQSESPYKTASSISQLAPTAADTGRNALIATLPTALESPQLDAATFDPFLGAAPLSPAQPKQVVPIAAPAAAPPPPVPPPRPMHYRYFGRLTSPAGEVRTFIAKGDQVVQAAAGVTLDDGYAVEAVTDQAVVIRHVPLDTRIEIPITSPIVEPLQANLR